LERDGKKGFLTIHQNKKRDEREGMFAKTREATTKKEEERSIDGEKSRKKRELRNGCPSGHKEVRGWTGETKTRPPAPVEANYQDGERRPIGMMGRTSMTMRGERTKN